MRTPLRKPHNIVSADIDNYNIDSEYVIFLDGSVYKAKNGETGAIDSQSTAAHTVIQYAIDNIGKGKVSLICDVVLTAGISGAAYVILDGNEHTISPATTFDIVTMKPCFKLRNCIFDVSGIAFNDVCILVDGDDDYFSTDKIQRTQISNCSGISTAQQGTFIKLLTHTASNQIAFVSVTDCTSRLFEYGFYLHSSLDDATCWMNSNFFDRIMGNGDKYFIYIEQVGASSVAENFFNALFQPRAQTDIAVYCEGTYNMFTGMFWDLGTCITDGFVFTASAEGNYINVPILTLTNVTDAGTNNFIFNHKDTGFTVTDNAIFNFFDEPVGNPSVYLWGDVTGVAKYMSLVVSADGIFRLGPGSATGMRIDAMGALSIAYNAYGNCNFFESCDTDTNRLLRVFGRNNADDARHNISLQWGDGTHEDGEIKTSSGDLRLSPTTGVVSFGTKTGTGDAVLDGYVTIKDAAGNTIKLATTA